MHTNQNAKRSQESFSPDLKFAEAVTAHTDDDAKDVGGPSEKESSDTATLQTAKGTERSLQCPICSKKFPNKGARKYTLMRHLSSCFKKQPIAKDQPLSHTIDESRRQRKCLLCAKSFKRLGRLKVHSRKHSGEKPHQCPMCVKRIRRMRRWKEHVLVKKRCNSKSNTQGAFLKAFAYGVLNYKFLKSKLIGVFGREAQGPWLF